MDPGGCIGGAGTLAPIQKSSRELEKYKNASPYFTVQDNPLAPKHYGQ